jgi:hypothetical protein
VIQGGSGLGFIPKPGQSYGILGKFLREEFQSDKTSQALIFSLVHHTHSTATQLFQDSVV